MASDTFEPVEHFIGVRIKVAATLENGSIEWVTVLVNAGPGWSLSQVYDAALDWLFTGGLISRTGRERYKVVVAAIGDTQLYEDGFDNPSLIVF